MKMRPKGFESRRDCGDFMKDLRDVMRDLAMGAWPEAFCMIALDVALVELFMTQVWQSKLSAK